MSPLARRPLSSMYTDMCMAATYAQGRARSCRRVLMRSGRYSVLPLKAAVCVFPQQTELLLSQRKVPES